MKKRLFIAINLPDKIKEQLADWLKDFIKLNQSQPIKWVRPEGLHITLHFLGYLDEEKTSAVREMLKRVINDFQKTELTFYQLDAFPNLRQPRVIIIKGKENKIITDSQAAIGVELKKLNIETDNRPWQPHLTLGRAKEPTTVKTKEIQPFSFAVESIELMESHLSSAGANYEILESYLL